ncbi:DNA (cytosine-5-)-methyltransferase [Pseudoxanthomonas gei]|uniref:DNA (cytosine-5-)-methyltransferase n=1 Tax=Pseudoxanthomonas gei TaxID=1383030 RepID=A0ABX0AE94_9GAMM|nr:DNA (cytosine-5-)-methyltransferase [Pseudoxanthomonas gei]NDK38815.1 DNA (cytosine-5-)-methyltransferase [Pseudoxanthomonas gei]
MIEARISQDKLGQAVRIGAAASILGVTAQTIRNWVAQGRLNAVRHPINGYRLFSLSEINKLVAASSVAPQVAVKGAGEEYVNPISYHWQAGKGIRTVLFPDGRPVVSQVESRRRVKDYGAQHYELDWLRSKRLPEPASLGRRVRVGDAFSGGGIFSLGVDEGLRAAGLVPVHAFGLDFDGDAIATFRHNFPTSVALHEDVIAIANGTVGAAETREEKAFLRSIGGGLDVLVAGPPCQGHSDLNNHTRREDPKNNLYFSTVRLSELLQPTFVIVENVPGVVHDRQGVVSRTSEALTRLGYEVSTSLVDLRRLGVPQARKRFVLVASRRGAFDIEQALAAQASEVRPVEWALADLQASYNEAVTYESSASHSAENRRRIDFLFENGLFELPNAERPPCHRDKTHSYVSVYGRMRWDKPAPTITGGFGSTGQGRFVHPLERRTLTPHEACRLQFVPDFFDFPTVTGRRAMQQIIGNAAPPKLSQAIVLGAALQGVLL